jgi:predicted enzyme related to lactoylglutathione lyase
MSVMTNGIGWFEIGTDEPDRAERFYGDLFGWSFTVEDDGDQPYRTVDTNVAGSIGGGVFPTGGKAPNYAIFYVVVDDVAETCRRAEAGGGKVIVPAQTTSNGLTFAHLLDPAGNNFGVYTPSAASKA